MDKIKEFKKIVWKYSRAHGRHTLPWRKTHDPYKILVSEIMLQQTQVDRVVPFYRKFIKQFPTARMLSRAPLSRVLIAWQGLGYNRRAKMLWLAAKELATGTKVSVHLPGVGPYTAKAVEAFAHNKNVIFIETNIRTAIIHHFFPKKKKVSDAEIEKILHTLLPRGKSRQWYGALMDYGASLKRSGISHNGRSHQYRKQSKFAGSMREARGAILKKLVYGAASPVELSRLFGASRRVQMRKALRALFSERLIEKKGEQYALAR